MHLSSTHRVRSFDVTQTCKHGVCMLAVNRVDWRPPVPVIFCNLAPEISSEESNCTITPCKSIKAPFCFSYAALVGRYSYLTLRVNRLLTITEEQYREDNRDLLKVQSTHFSRDGSLWGAKKRSSFGAAPYT
eukprot:1153565-Pelagomonas_calceolata.AAC.1